MAVGFGQNVVSNGVRSAKPCKAYEYMPDFAGSSDMENFSYFSEEELSMTQPKQKPISKGEVYLGMSEMEEKNEQA